MIAYTVRYFVRYFDTYSWGFKRKLALAALSVLFGFLSQSVVLAQVACPSGLVHHFGLDETEAGSYQDYKSATVATCTGCPAPADSRFAGGQRFNGSTTGLLISDIENFEWNQNSDFTMEVWVQASNRSENQVIVGRRSANGPAAWWLGVNPEGFAVFDMKDNAGVSHMVTDYLKLVNLFDGKWHHLAVVREGGPQITKLYVDGFRVDDLRIHEKMYEGSFESESPVTIGYLDLGSMFRFNGVIDEFRVYNRNLSESEMRSRYDNGSGAYCGPRTFAPEIVSTPITFATVGQQYTHQVYATGNPAPSYRLLTTVPGMSINSRLGIIDWVPTQTGTFTVEVMAINSAGESAPQRFQINVRAATEEPIGILHHWMLNETSGNSFADVYTPIDAIPETKRRPAAVKGAVGTGQRFNGRDTGLDVIGSPNFNWKTNETFTIELWIRTETKEGLAVVENQVLIGRHAKDSPSQWWLGLDKDRKAAFLLPDIEYQGHTNLVGSTGPKLNDGAWHQLVVVRNGGTGDIMLYVDGELIDADRVVHQNEFSSRSPVTIGYFNASLSNSFQYEGDLDEVKLFGRALSPEEIRNRYTEVYNDLTEFLSFTGRYADGEGFGQKVVLLDWRTLYEFDTDFFDIERSADGENFASIGQVGASGTTTAAIDYTYTDATPLKEQGYYRLRLVRGDGTFMYSNIILVQDRSPIASSFRVFPNPAARGDELTVKVSNLPESEDVTFRVTDATGKLMFSQQVQTDGFGDLNLTMPVSASLTPGIYNLTVSSSSKTLNRKLVVAQ